MDFVVTFSDKNSNETNLKTIRKLATGKSDVFHVKGPFSEEYAVKAFFKDEASFKRYKREKEMITVLEHPNIIKYHPVVEHNSDYDLIITEYAHNGDFFGLITRGVLSHEVHIRTYFHQLIAGIEYMHSKNVAHLDLKLENLLLDKDFVLKIIDFDQSHNRGETQISSSGTNSYRPPEIKSKTCTDMCAADVFSMGIILYAFKARKFPFVEIEENGETKFVSYDLFMENNEEFWRQKEDKNGKNEVIFGEDLKSLLKGMLERDPCKRMTIQDIKASTWFNKPILVKESLNAYMTQVFNGSTRSPSIEKPKKSQPSSFQGISSPKAKRGLGLSFEGKLWKCSTQKAKEEEHTKHETASGSDLSKIEDSSKGATKSTFDLKIWGVLTPKASQASNKNKDSQNKFSFFGPSETTNTQITKSKSSLKFWNFQSSSKTSSSKTYVQDGNEQIKPKETNILTSNGRRPIRLAH